MPHALERVAKHEPSAFDRAEQVATHRETAALNTREQQRRAAGGVNATLDLGDFEPGIDFGIDSHEVAMALEIVDAFAERSIAHA